MRKGFKVLSFAALSLVGATALAAAPQNMASSQKSQQASKATFMQQQYDAMTNNPAEFPSTSLTSTGWFKNIRFSLLGAAGYWYQTDTDYLDPVFHAKKSSGSHLTADSLALNADAHLSPMINAYISLFYAAGDWLQPAGVSALVGGDGDNSRYYDPFHAGTLALDMAYVTIGNFAKSPFKLRIGRQYLSFGNYDRYAAIPSLTQMLSELSDVAINLSYVSPVGVHGSIYTFHGMQKKQANGSLEGGLNAGASLAYTHAFNRASLNVGADYLYNMIDVRNMYYAHTIGTSVFGLPNGYAQRVGGLALNMDAQYGPVSVAYKYVTSLGDFSPADMFWTSNANFSQRTHIPSIHGQGARMSANTLLGTFRFKTGQYRSSVTGTYQWSSQALAGMPEKLTGQTTYLETFLIPRTRYGATYELDLSKAIALQGIAYHDQAYAKQNLGTGQSNTTLMARVKITL